jgi:GNAT superfamily N-acetyltransferase
MRTSILKPGDEPALERLLSTRAETSMFLRSNSQKAGLTDRGEKLQATYAAVWEGEEIVAVAAHCWNGIVLVQAPEPRHIDDVVRLAVETSGRAVKGFSGAWEQVVAARRTLGLEGQAAMLDSREDLFALDLSKLAVPRALATGEWICRTPAPGELSLLATWRAAYYVEAIGETPGPLVDARALQDVRNSDAQWVVAIDGEPRAYSGFNARLPDMVQIGGVYTPPTLRGGGYARAVVAGSLLSARSAGVRRAILFTGQDNVAARRAYLALGFEIIGDFGLVMFS